MNLKQNLSAPEFKEEKAGTPGCKLCPRLCRTDRNNGRGFCGETNNIKVSRAVLHFGEEPCISGTNGSGAIFFSGCPMHCVFCQNYSISNGSRKLAENAEANEVSPEKLREIYFRLIEQGAHNINLVTPTHYTDGIIKSLQGGLPVPVIWNTSGYERIETLQKLEGIVQIYLPDFKYSSSLLADEYSKAADYPEIAEAAIREMIRQAGKYELDKNGIIKSGVIVRHLVLPGHVKNSKAVIKYLLETYQDQILISIMNQYTPMPQVSGDPLLSRKVTKREYEKVIDYALELGMEDGFIQEGEAAKESFIPEFDCEGV